MNRPMRAAAQLSFAAFGVLPLAHSTRLLAQHPEALGAMQLCNASIAVLVLGVLVYANRVTERLFPRRVDLFGSSHNVRCGVGSLAVGASRSSYPSSPADHARGCGREPSHVCCGRAGPVSL